MNKSIKTIVVLATFVTAFGQAFAMENGPVFKVGQKVREQGEKVVQNAREIAGIAKENAYNDVVDLARIRYNKTQKRVEEMNRAGREVVEKQFTSKVKQPDVKKVSQKSNWRTKVSNIGTTVSNRFNMYVANPFMTRVFNPAKTYITNNKKKTAIGVAATVVTLVGARLLYSYLSGSKAKKAKILKNAKKDAKKEIENNVVVATPEVVNVKTQKPQEVVVVETPAPKVEKVQVVNAYSMNDQTKDQIVCLLEDELKTKGTKFVNKTRVMELAKGLPIEKLVNAFYAPITKRSGKKESGRGYMNKARKVLNNIK